MFSFADVKVKLLPHFVSSLLKVTKTIMLFQNLGSRSGKVGDSVLLGSGGVW
jgi:hypothetical protein